MIDIALYDPHSPKSIHEISGNNDTWGSLYEQIQDKRATNFILVGPSGCGKSLFLKLALQKHTVLSIECTANSGLRDVRDSIRVFARGSRTKEGNLRWIVFEHADNLTADTQAFLRRMLETTSNTTRFVFECRDAGAITEPILSRSSMVTVQSPDDTEIMYEIQRRTNFKLSSHDVENICKISFGNVRSAILYALYTHICKKHINLDAINKILELRPIHSESSAEWMKWAIDTEINARNNGIDLRDILRIGWPSNSIVNHTCAIWSRLGGTSPRTLFFDCIAKLELCG
jgi:replication-associated recombination protein RarA